MCIEDEYVMEFIKLNSYKPPLNPRDGFFGGRTEAFSLYNNNIKAIFMIILRCIQIDKSIVDI